MRDCSPDRSNPPAAIEEELIPTMELNPPPDVWPDPEVYLPEDK